MYDSKKNILSLLSLPDDGSIQIDSVDHVENVRHVHLSRPAVPTFCPSCGCRMYSKGNYMRKIHHPIYQDSTFVTIHLKQRKWHCRHCGSYMNESFPFVEPYQRNSNITTLMILEAMKDLNRSASSIGKQFYVSDTEVHDIFTAYVDLPRLELAEYISIDEVHLDICESQKYAFVIIDFVTGEIIDIVHNRWTNTLERYFLNIPLKERMKVKGIISDAYAPYLTSIPEFFPRAVSILDSFHVSRILISNLNLYVNKLMRNFQDRDRKLQGLDEKEKPKDSQEVVLLRKYRWILLKNEDEINYSWKRYYHKQLGMNVDTYQIEEMFFKVHPKLKLYRDLKEKYIQFNHGKYSSEEEAKLALKALIKEFWASGEWIFVKFAGFLDLHIPEIVRSFTTVEVSRKSHKEEASYYTRLSNGLMESFNRKPKDYKRMSRGSSNFDYTRNRILWATRKNPTIRGIPKTAKQIHSYRLKKKTLEKRRHNRKHR